MNYRALVIVVLAVAAGVAQNARAAESDPEDLIKYRKNVMKATAGHMAAAGAIVQGKVQYKADLPEHAKALAALLHDVNGLFPKDSDFGDTKAQPAVWLKNAEFKKLADDSRAKAEALVKVAGDVKAAGPAFKALADSCKACHKDFRKEDQ